uniref:Uncharacterized protein n=1 Tax=Leptobrachium leishanense TaxID=445787 RepID=A0A8C5PKN6_9ANUR
FSDVTVEITLPFLSSLCRLRACGLTPSCCKKLRSAIITNRSLIILDLSENKLQDSGVKRLCKGLRHPGCVLQELRLNHCILTSSTCKQLRSVIITNRSLITLDLSRNILQDSGIKHLCEGLRLPDCVLLERCGLTPSCCEDLYSVIITNRSLIKLDLTHNNLEVSGMKRLCEGLRHPDCVLKELGLESCDLISSNYDDLRSFIITNRYLITLDLSETELQDSGVKRLCEGLRHPGCVLRELGLESCGLTPSCCEDLYTVIITNRSLIKLNLTDNYLQDSGVKPLCEGLRLPDCKLQELCGLTASCCEDLLSVITNRSLITLDLSENELDSGVKRLCKGLSHPDCVLQNLGLRACDVTSSCCKHLCSAFITNRSLIVLDLSWNYLQDSGVKHLCEGLMHPGCVLQELVDSGSRQRQMRAADF